MSLKAIFLILILPHQTSIKAKVASARTPDCRWIVTEGRHDVDGVRQIIATSLVQCQGRCLATRDSECRHGFDWNEEAKECFFSTGSDLSAMASVNHHDPDCSIELTTAHTPTTMPSTSFGYSLRGERLGSLSLKLVTFPSQAEKRTGILARLARSAKTATNATTTTTTTEKPKKRKPKENRHNSQQFLNNNWEWLIPLVGAISFASFLTYKVVRSEYERSLVVDQATDEPARDSIDILPGTSKREDEEPQQAEQEVSNHGIDKPTDPQKTDTQETNNKQQKANIQKTNEKETSDTQKREHTHKSNTQKTDTRRSKQRKASVEVIEEGTLEDVKRGVENSIRTVREVRSRENFAKRIGKDNSPRRKR